jgi:colanic acid/amylovoran biosynthesis glycosyltransferase
MKIVFCAYDGKNIINGVNTWLCRLLPSLIKAGFEVHVIFILWADQHECTVFNSLKNNGIKCIEIPYPNYTNTQIKWILHYIKKERPFAFVPGDVIPALYSSKWICKSGIATIGILHNDDGFYEAIIENFINQQKNLDVIVPVSTALYHRLLINKRDIIIKQIAYGSDITLNKSRYNKCFKVVYVGRIDQEQKKIFDIIELFCQCATTFPDFEAHIYGSGPDFEEVLKMKYKFNDPSNVFIHGIISNEQIQEILPQFNAIVLLSDYEGIPVALMEGMGAGLVPICKKIKSGIPELVIDNETGFLIESLKDLSTKIKYLIDNQEDWERLSNNARNLIQEKFSSKQNLKSWLILLQELKPKKIRRVKIPIFLNLPQIQKAFTHLDHRSPGILKKVINRIKRELKISRSA